MISVASMGRQTPGRNPQDQQTGQKGAGQKNDQNFGTKKMMSSDPADRLDRVVGTRIRGSEPITINSLLYCFRLESVSSVVSQMTRTFFYLSVACCRRR